MDSGYIPVTNEDYLFYWHFGPKAAPPGGDNVTPIIFWTNGGPGCSAMEGAINELGPLKLFKSKDGSDLYTGALSDNPYSWNAYAHLVTVDQPRYVGYSFGTGQRSSHSVHSSADAGRDIVAFIRGWFAAYPEVPRDAPVFIAGESYSGHYVPAWGTAIMDHNAASEPADAIRLSGIALGNACVDDNVQVDGAKYLEFLRVSRLMDPNANPRTAYQGTSAASTHLGYWPNFYDYRIKKVNCEGCYDYNYNDFGDFLMQPEVKTALGVCPDAGNEAFGDHAGGCINMGGFDRGVSNDAFTQGLGRALDNNIPVMLYFGKTDLACDYVGGIAMARELPWRGREQFQAAPLMDLTIAGAAAAQIKGHGALAWLQIDSAGHMVPADQPAAAFFAIRHLLNNFTTSLHGAAGPCPPPAQCPTCPTCPAPQGCPSVETTALPGGTASTVPSQCPAPPPCPLCPTSAPVPLVADDANPIRCPTTATSGNAAQPASDRSKLVGLAAALGTALFVVSGVLLCTLLGCFSSDNSNPKRYRGPARKSNAYSINQTNALYKGVLDSSDEDDF